MRVCVCPIIVILIIIIYINTGMAIMPNDRIQNTQNDSPIINPISYSLKEYRWDSMSGLITSNAITFKDSLGQSHILAKGSDNGLWDNVDGVWQDLGGVITSDPCAVKDRLGVTHIFVIGTDGALWDWVLSTGWTNLGGYVTSNPSAALSPDGHIKIAVKSGDNGLLVKDLTTGEWSNLGGKITSNPQLIFDLQGKMHVLARGGDGALWDNVDGTWQCRGGIMTSDARPIINPFNPGFIFTYVRGGDGSLWCNALDTASVTSTWTGLGGLIVGTPSPLVDTDGVLHNFVRGSDNGLWDNADGNWYDLGGSIISDPCALRDKNGKLRVAVVGEDNGLWVNTVGIGMTPTNLVGSFACDYYKIQSAIDAISSGGIVKVLRGNYPEDVNINKELTLTGTGNPTASSFTLNAILRTNSGGITAPLITVNAGFKIKQGIELANTGASVNVIGAAGYTYSDDLTQSFYAKGITLTGINNPVIKSFTLDQDIAGRISGIAANTVNVNPNAKIMQGIKLANTGASVNVNGAAGYTYNDELTQSFYARGITLTGINNPVINSFTLDRDIAGKISGINANTVIVNPNAKILQGIKLANSGASVNVNGAAGYTYSDDLTQSFFAKGITLTGINNPVTKSISLDQLLAGRINGIAANTVNVLNPNAKIQDGINLVYPGGTINVGAGNYPEDVDINKDLILIGTGNSVVTSISLNTALGTFPNGISASKVTVNPTSKILDGILISSKDVYVNGAAGYTYSDDLTQSFYAKGITLTGINNPVIKSFTLDQDIAGKISGIAANTINVNPNAKILQGIELANTGASVNVNGAAGYTYNDDLTQSFYAKGITLTGINNPVTKSISLDKDIAGEISGINANTINVLNPNAKVQNGVILASSGGTVNVAAGIYKENIMVDKSLTVNGAGAVTSIVDGNKAGSVFTLGKNDANVDVSLSGMKLTGGTGTPDTGGTFGGGIINYGNLLVRNCAISENTADYGGGIQNAGITTIADATISGNIANKDGGGISCSGTLTMNNGNISGNTATEGGGGISNSGTLNLGGGNISGNTAVWGSGISNSGTITLNGGSITENAATEGGGIRNSGTMIMKSGSISGNAATVSGGGIGNSGTLNLGGGSITGNKAVCGGGIGNAGTITLNSGSITKNTATDGGGIFNDNHGTMNMDGGSIEENIANVRGGGIYSLGGTVNIDGGSINKNMANVSGGGIYSNDYVTLNLDGGEIIENFATYYGGGIYSQGTMHLHGGNITGNVASDGGGIYSSGTITMNSGSINMNTANNGAGGGFFNAGTLNLGGGSIAENTAINGGGVYSSIHSHIAFDGVQVVIKSNKAHLPSPSELNWYQGWGVYLDDGTPTVTSDFDPATQVTGNIHI